MANLAYQNVSNLFPKSDFTLQGPLAGAMGGLQTMYGLNDLNNSAALSEINKQAENLKLMEAQKNVPVDDLKRQQAEQDLGWNIANADKRYESQIEQLKKPGYENQKTQQEAKEKEVKTRAYETNQVLSDLFDVNTGEQQRPDLVLNSMYPSIKSRLEAVGVRGLPESYDDNARKILSSHARAAGQATERFAHLEQARLTGQMHLEGTKYSADQHLKGALAAAAASRENAEARLPITRQIEKEVESKGILEQGDIERYIQATAAKKDPNVIEAAKNVEKEKLNKKSNKEFEEYKKKIGADPEDTREDVAKKIVLRDIQVEQVKGALRALAPLANKGVSPEVAKVAEMVGLKGKYDSAVKPSPPLPPKQIKYTPADLKARGYKQNSNGDWVLESPKPITIVSPEGN